MTCVSQVDLGFAYAYSLCAIVTFFLSYWHTKVVAVEFQQYSYEHVHTGLIILLVSGNTNLNPHWIEEPSGNMRLCNEGGRGLKWLKSYHEVCIIIRQLHYLRQNEPNKRFNWHWKVKNCKCLSGGSTSLEIAKLLRYDHRTIKHFVAINQQGRKKRTEKKMRILTTWGELNLKLPGTHYPPVPQYSRTATCLEYPELQGVKYSET